MLRINYIYIHTQGHRTLQGAEVGDDAATTAECQWGDDVATTAECQWGDDVATTAECQWGELLILPATWAADADAEADRHHSSAASSSNHHVWAISSAPRVLRTSYL